MIQNVPPAQNHHTDSRLSIRPYNLATQANGAKTVPQFYHIASEDGSEAHSFLRWLWWSPRVEGCTDARTLDSSLENCWQFLGSRGQFGIRLGSVAAIKQVVIEQPSSLTVSPHSPRDVVVWGVVDGQENFDRLKDTPNLQSSLLKRHKLMTPTPVLSNLTLIPLAAFTYEVNLLGRQYFEVFEELVVLGVDIGLLLIQVQSNWGAPSIQLCHIGIFGVPVGVA